MQRFLISVDKLSTLVGHAFSFLIVVLTLMSRCDGGSYSGRSSGGSFGGYSSGGGHK